MLARLGLWSGSLEAIERLPVPTNETIGRFHTNFEELLATRAAVEKRMRERNGECTDIEDEIDGMRRKGVFLTEDELAGTRDRRDKTWGLIRGAWLQAEELERPASDVAQEYEQEVKTADDHADMLRKNAEQVATLTERLRQKERLQKKNQEDSAELERIMKGQEQVAAEWAATWLGSGIDPLPPKEMQAWLQRHAQLLELCRQIRVTRAREQEADMEIKAGVESLNLSLKALDESPCAPDETYGKLIERCKALVFRLSKMNSDLEARAKSIDDLEQDRQLLERELGKAQSAWTRWQQDWAECMQWLGLPPKTSIDEADSYIEKVDTLLGCSKETTDLTERITGIKKDAESLESEVRALVVAIAPDLSNRSISEAIEELQRRFLKDKESVTQQREYLNKQAETQIQLDDACATLIEADRELAQLCQEAGCDTPDQLEQIEQKSMERRELMRGVEQVEESLQTIAKGIPLEKLEDEASSMDADSLFALIPSAKEKIRSLGNEKDQENMNIGQITEKIAALKGRSGAAHAAEMAQQHLALIEEKSRQYIKLKLASIVLRGEIKKYQTINQGPLLARAGDLFARLTLNSFTKLSVDYNEKDDPFLLGFRPTGETVPVEGMSDGTRDQLYLSLRLATLEKFLETSEPMPFIVDDILIRFDDERAKATLDVLAELATKTQVLFFTHHARLFEFSRSPEMTGKVRALNLQK
jgi:uncharacterized protein YhaN